MTFIPQTNLGASITGGNDPSQEAPPAPAIPQADPAALQQAASGGVAQATPAQSGSRLARIVQAVAGVANTALAGIPDKGRSSFVTGLGEGARSAQAAQAYQNEIKFRDFNTQLRLAALHRQDLAQQQQTDEQTKAQQAMQDFQKEAFDTPNALKYVPHPNDGAAVTKTLQAQTAANGAADVPAGTHLNADGTTINVPDNDPQTLAAQVAKYKSLQGVVPFLPTMPQYDPNSVKSTQDVVNARNDLGKHLDMMTHILEGHDANGGALTHNDLNNLIPALQSQRDSLAKSGNANPYQLGTLDKLLDIYKSQEAMHTDAEQKVAKFKTSQQEEVQTNQIQQRGAQQRQTNAAKPQKPQSPDWVSGATADEKKKAELAENMVFNANNIASILQRRPDIVGKVAGRITNVQQMAGTNDPDIVQLSTDIHNIAMANNGIHGLRSAEAVTDFENKLLNNFKNGPRGIAGGLRGSVNSVQTFIDNARPDTYKTHSKNGGAIKAMVPNQ
jgi:hypothetical protein